MVFGCELGLLKCLASHARVSRGIDMIGGGTCMEATIFVFSEYGDMYGRLWHLLHCFA